MHAGASAASWTCGDYLDIKDGEDTARKLAKAVAEAITLTYASCALDDGGYACTSVDSSISLWVDAVVLAWADAWANEVQCTNKCDVSVDMVFESVGRTLVDAATDAYGFLCAGGAPPFLAV
jgi:hypothetical protein